MCIRDRYTRVDKIKPRYLRNVLLINIYKNTFMTVFYVASPIISTLFHRPDSFVIPFPNTLVRHVRSLTPWASSTPLHVAVLQQVSIFLLAYLGI